MFMYNRSIIYEMYIYIYTNAQEFVMIHACYT